MTILRDMSKKRKDRQDAHPTAILRRFWVVEGVRNPVSPRYRVSNFPKTSAALYPMVHANTLLKKSYAVETLEFIYL